MHGRDHRRIIERRGGGGCGRQLMRSLSLSNTRRSLADREEPTLVTNSVDNTDSVDSFCKDGRKISVGDCALFKPPQDSPPFVGIIRCLRYCEEKNLQLGVSWLYRPVELELGKGTLLEASPNEIFYSFHEDETPAASLLHPCKVAFLPKGVELPSGTSSFVCRRVYDVETKCLWWLTDRDYINERQEEVDRLLHITRLEMDASFQPGSPSPKLTNNPMSTSQFKQGSDNVQGSAGSVPSQTKARKRERGDQSFIPVKRERSVKSEEADTSPYKHESSLRSEIAKMKEKGGLVDYESVEKLVQLMQLEKVNKKGNLASCSMLAGVIAATDKFECLTRFIQLKGLPVFDEWLQDVHKGKIGYVSNLKDGEKSVEEFLLALLRALDKLPVNLHALQSCNIGRSVNHLRSHKNLEVQRKARSLVDTWKKRVEAEMNATDAKTGSPQAGAWSAKSRLPDAHGSKTPGGSGDNALKTLASQPASKPMSVKVTPVEPAGNSTSSSPGVVKAASSPASGKEGNPRITAGSSDAPLSTRDEKSSGSSQSHNFSQSFSAKDDARSSPVGATSTSKVSSRHRKSVNGYPGTTLASTNQRDMGSNRNSSAHRSPAQEKVLPPVAMVDKTMEAPPVEGNPHKLIVKIPNRGRSPAQSASGGSYEEPVTSSLASSPVPTGKHEGSERNKKEKGDTCKANHLSDANADSWQSNDLKGLQAGSDEGDGSPAPRGEKRSRTVENTRRGPEVSKAASSSSVKLKSAKLHGASFSSMNALIESCVKHSEANISMSPADDVGMNLLASVAAGEICKSDLPPNEASQGCTPPVEEQCTSTGNMNLKSTPDETPESSKANLKYSKSMGSLPNNIASLSKQPAIHSSGHKTPDIFEASPQAATVCATEKNGRVDDNLISNSLSLPCKVPKDGDGDVLRQPGDQGVKVTNTISGAEEMDHKVEIPVTSVSKTSENRDVSGLGSSVLVEQKPAILTEGNVQPDTAYVKDSVPDIPDKLRKREAGENHILSSVGHSKGGSVDRKTSRAVTPGDKKLPSLCSEINGQKSDRLKTSGEENEASEPCRLESCTQKEASSIHVTGNTDVRGSNHSEAEAAVKVELGSAVALPSKNEPGVSSKVGFDLNEGLMSDEGKYGESVHSVNSGCLPVQVISPVSTAATAFSNCVPVSVTVTAAAKGAFVPPVDLLRSKGELGWKGSAVTSAFRPAEPRKVLQSPMTSLNISTPDFSSNKPCRPALDIDLNVPDERVFEDLGCRDFKMQMGSSPVHLSMNNQLESEIAGPAAVRSFGGLDLDLNKVDDTNDMLQCSTSSSFHRLDAPSIPLKLSPPSLLHSSEVRRDFDLNGPSFEDASAERPSFTLVGRGSTHSINTQQALPGLRSNNLEAGNFSPWFSPGTSYPPISIPSSLPDRGEQPFSVLPPGTQRVVGPGCNPFTSDVFRGSILTSQAVPFAPSPFTYQMFPFGATVPLPSTSFSVGSTSFMDSQNGGRIFAPSGNSQFLAPASAVSSQYPRPYMVNLSDNGNNGGMENSRKWSRQGLDLNTGPGALDFDSREETAQRQLTLGSSQAHAEDPARMFPPSGGLPKQREPEGGWDADNMRYKQHSWQ